MSGNVTSSPAPATHSLSRLHRRCLQKAHPQIAPEGVDELAKSSLKHTRDLFINTALGYLISPVISGTVYGLIHGKGMVKSEKGQKDLTLIGVTSACVGGCLALLVSMFGKIKPALEVKLAELKQRFPAKPDSPHGVQ